MEPMSSMTTVTITVTNAEEDESLTLSPMAPSVGDMVTATLASNGGDEIVSRDSVQWSKSMTMSGNFMNISGATSMSYQAMAADENYYLRATVMYTDTHGSQTLMEETSSAVMMVTDPNAGLLNRYDTDRDGRIGEDEFTAILSLYLFPSSEAERVSEDDFIRLLSLYLFPPSS